MRMNLFCIWRSTSLIRTNQPHPVIPIYKDFDSRHHIRFERPYQSVSRFFHSWDGVEATKMSREVLENHWTIYSSSSFKFLFLLDKLTEQLLQYILISLCYLVIRQQNMRWESNKWKVLHLYSSRNWMLDKWWTPVICKHNKILFHDWPTTAAAVNVLWWSIVY